MNRSRRAIALAIASVACASAHGQTQQTKPPIATYGVDVATRTMSIPGMPAGGMMGMAMPGGMGMGPQKELWLGLRSSQKAAGATEAQHAIPPGMNMGLSPVSGSRVGFCGGGDVGRGLPAAAAGPP